jgi:hypothetical protein
VQRLTQADFEHERDRRERLIAEVVKTTAGLMVARELAARDLEAFKARPWWRRLAEAVEPGPGGQPRFDTQENCLWRPEAPHNL